MRRTFAAWSPPSNNNNNNNRGPKGRRVTTPVKPTTSLHEAVPEHRRKAVANRWQRRLSSPGGVGGVRGLAGLSAGLGTRLAVAVRVNVASPKWDRPSECSPPSL